MSLEKLVAIVFPGELSFFDQRMVAYRPNQPDPARWDQQVKQLAAAFERGEVGEKWRKAIFEIRERCKTPADSVRKFTCTKLLALAEQRQPTPDGAPKYL